MNIITYYEQLPELNHNSKTCFFSILETQLILSIQAVFSRPMLFVASIISYSLRHTQYRTKKFALASMKLFILI